MKNEKKYRSLLLSVLLSMLSIFLPHMAFADAGCGGFDLTIKKYHYEARVLIDESEACGIGNYHLIIKTPGGRVSHFTAQRDGFIQQVWLEPLGKSKQPAVILWVQNVGSGSYGELNVYVPSVPNPNNYVRDKIAPLPSTVKGYGGHEQYMVTDGDIYLIYPRYKPNDPMCCPSDGQAIFRYNFQKKQWIEQ